MLKKQTIVKIKSPQLRRIRLNLRTLFTHFYYDQESVLKGIWLGAEKDEQLPLLRKLEDFRQKYSDSILECSACSKLDGDRVYIPRHKCWYCTDCLKKGNIQSLRKLRKRPS